MVLSPGACHILSCCWVEEMHERLGHSARGSREDSSNGVEQLAWGFLSKVGSHQDKILGVAGIQQHLDTMVNGALGR